MNENDIKQALDQIEPSDEALSRMLTNILSANEQSARESSDSYNATSEANNAPENTPASKISAKKGGRWRVALPVAASLILLLGVGIFVVNQELFTPGSMDANFSAMSSKSTAESSSESALAEQDMPPNADEESAYSNSSENLIDSSHLAQTYPLIESPSLGRLSIIDNGESANSSADTNLVGAKIEEGIAKSPSGEAEISCTIYEYISPDVVYYAIQYDGDTNYYRASTLTR